MASDLPPPYSALTRHPMMPRTNHDETARFNFLTHFNLYLSGTVGAGNKLAYEKQVVPVAPVYELGDAMDNPFLQPIGMRDTADRPARDNIQILASPIKLDGQRLPNRAAPLLGADSDDILGDLGYDEDAIAKLRAGGVI